MKKSILKIMIIIAASMLAIFSLSACNKAVQLTAPTGVTANTETKLLSWNAVENASGYKVSIGEAESEEQVELSYNLAALSAGTYILKVKALGDGKKYIDSEWSAEARYTSNSPSAEQLAVPANVKVEGKTLTWATVANASGYFVQIDTNTPIYLNGNSTTSYSLASLTECKTYQIKVKTLGDGTNYADSAWSASVDYTIENLQNKVTVTFNSMGGSAVDKAVIEKGDKVKEPDNPDRIGYTFDGWYADDKFTPESRWVFIGYSVTENMTLYANWTANKYVISFNANEGSNAPSSVTVTYDSYLPIIYTTSTKTGYRFAGFFDSAVGGTKYYDADLSRTVSTWSIPSNTMLYAQWEVRVVTIKTKEELVAFAEQVRSGQYYSDTTFELQADIDLGDDEWIPIGNSSEYSYNSFSGIFDGKGYKISNFKITNSGSRLGLFARNHGIIRNLGVESFTINASANHAGGLVGENYGTIMGCYTTGNLNMTAYSGYVYAGGLVGSNSSTTYSGRGIIRNSYATGGVSAKASLSTGSVYAGGLAGSNGNIIANCYATGNVFSETPYTVTAYSGGLIGFSAGNISNCYATGNVRAEISYYGRANSLIGRFYNDNTLIRNCYTLSGQGSAVYSCTVVQLDDILFYTDTLGWDGDIWDFSNLDFENGMFPKLKSNEE